VARQCEIARRAGGHPATGALTARIVLDRAPVTIFQRLHDSVAADGGRADGFARALIATEFATGGGSDVRSRRSAEDGALSDRVEALARLRIADALRHKAGAGRRRASHARRVFAYARAVARVRGAEVAVG